MRQRTTDELIEETRKKLVKMGRKETLFRLKGDKPGNWRTVTHVYDAGCHTFIMKKYGGLVELIANADFAKAALLVTSRTLVDNR